MASRTVCLLLILCVLPGCLHDVWTWDQCDVDPSACEYEGNFPVADDCADKTPLQVALGWGEASYAPIAESHAFQTYFGPQGGSHVYAALRVDNPSPSSDRFEAEIEILDDDACSQNWLGPPEGCPPLRVGYRKVILRGKQLKKKASAVEVAGITVYHESWGGPGGDRMTLSLRDLCGRVGTDTRAMLP